MKQVVIVGEDELCCALGKRLVEAAMPGWLLAGEPINKRGCTKLFPELPRYAKQARHVQPVLCIADTDGQCVKELLQQWHPKDSPPGFHFRLAVTESESWVLADRNRFARFFCVPSNKIPNRADEIENPKRLILNLMQRSKKRLFREEMVSSSDMNKPGSGYNLHLTQFVQVEWCVEDACLVSQSLHRAFNRLKAFAES